MSYRVVLWHVADVPGGRGKWKLGSLEAWRLGFLGGAPPHTLQLLRRALVARSVLRGRGRFGPPGLHALFSVLRGGISRPTPAGAWGSAPHLPISQSANLLCALCEPLCPLW